MKTKLMTTLMVMLLVLLAGVTIVYADPLLWKGIDWDPSIYGSIAVNVGNLEVTTASFGTSSWGTAHYNTPNSFRAAPTPWVKVTFLDSPGTAAGQLWMEDETYNSNYGLNTGTLGAWTQFGAWERADRPNYMIYWWDYDTGLDGFVDTGFARTAGAHTLLLGKRVDGTIDYWLDGWLVFSTTDITPNYFGDIYLAAHSPGANPGQTIVFTDYQTGTDYSFSACARHFQVFESVIGYPGTKTLVDKYGYYGTTVSYTELNTYLAQYQWICTGFTGTGSAPGSGSSNSVSFPIYQDSTVTFYLQRQVLQTFDASANVKTDGTGTIVTVTYPSFGVSTTDSVPVASLPYSVFVDSYDGTVTYSFSPTVASTVSGKLYRYDSFSGPATGYDPSSPHTVTATYVTLSPRGLKLDAIAELETAKDGLKGDVAKKIGEAIGKIKESLKDSLWVSDTSLNLDRGQEVFDREKDAVHILMDLINDGKVPSDVKAECRKVVDKLLMADKALAEKALQDAQAIPSPNQRVLNEIGISQGELVKAAQEIAKGHFDSAVDHYKHAWEHARSALKFA